MRATAAIRVLPLVLLLAVSCDKASKIPYEEPVEGMQTIAYLKSLCTAASVAITRDITVCGTVTANDRYGEFYKTIVVEDASGGISIAVDCTQTADKYPFGTIITIHCNGLTLCDYGGKIQLGTEPGENGAGRIAPEDADRYLKCDYTAAAPIEANTLSLIKVGPEHIDTYVCFEHVRFTAPCGWCDLDTETQKPVTTEREIADGAGRTFTVRTLGTALYAKETVPEGTVSIKGIVDYFGGKYCLRIVNRDFTQISAARRPTAYPSGAGY